MTSPYMRLTEQLIELDNETEERARNFPAIERHRLAAAMRAGSRELQRLSIVAWKRKQKSSTLFDLDVQVELFRRDVRKAHRCQYISDGGLHHWMALVNAVGKSVGGWIRFESEREKAEKAERLARSKEATGKP